MTNYFKRLLRQYKKPINTATIDRVLSLLKQGKSVQVKGREQQQVPEDDTHMAWSVEVEISLATLTEEIAEKIVIAATQEEVEYTVLYLGEEIALSTAEMLHVLGGILLPSCSKYPSERKISQVIKGLRTELIDIIATIHGFGWRRWEGFTQRVIFNREIVSNNPRLLRQLKLACHELGHFPECSQPAIRLATELGF